MKNPLMAPFTLTLVWSKQSNTLKLYHNNDLMGTGTLSENNSSANCTSFNEYLLVYADYYNNQSDLRASLSSIKLWSIPLSEDEISFTLSKDLLCKCFFLFSLIKINNKNNENFNNNNNNNISKIIMLMITK